jgi:hypothetical protein
MKDDPESVAWREKMRSGLHYDPKAETIKPLPKTDAESGLPMHPEEAPVEPTVKFLESIERSLGAVKYLESIDKSLGTIKHILVFFFWLTIIGIIVALIAAISR